MCLLDTTSIFHTTGPIESNMNHGNGSPTEHVANTSSSSQLNENANVDHSLSESQTKCSSSTLPSSHLNSMFGQTRQVEGDGGSRQMLDSMVALEALLRINKMAALPALPVPALNGVFALNQLSSPRFGEPTSHPSLQNSHDQITPPNIELLPQHIVSDEASLTSLYGISKNNVSRTNEIVQNEIAGDPKIYPQSNGDGIRKHLIEQALRSKSQRGKKRESLSEEERLELTRTRNREHAKTTR